jgi:hypothetical protein
VKNKALGAKILVLVTVMLVCSLSDCISVNYFMLASNLHFEGEAFNLPLQLLIPIHHLMGFQFLALLFNSFLLQIQKNKTHYKSG